MVLAIIVLLLIMIITYKLVRFLASRNAEAGQLGSGQ
jgi:hypothetical protein